jgi:hypothetical protein
LYWDSEFRTIAGVTSEAPGVNREDSKSKFHAISVKLWEDILGIHCQNGILRRGQLVASQLNVAECELKMKAFALGLIEIQTKLHIKVA